MERLPLPSDCCAELEARGAYMEFLSQFDHSDVRLEVAAMGVFAAVELEAIFGLFAGRAIGVWGYGHVAFVALHVHLSHYKKSTDVHNVCIDT